MKIVFAHGMEGNPNGTKATYLREEFDAITPNLHGLPLLEQVEILKNLIKENPDCLLLGSSILHWQHLNFLGEYDFNKKNIKDSVGLKGPSLVKSNVTKMWSES